MNIKRFKILIGNSMNIKIIQTLLDVFRYYGESIRLDLERFENALNDEAPDLVDERYLVVQGLQSGIFEMMIFDDDYRRIKYIDYLKYVQNMNEEEALLTTIVFEICFQQYGYDFEIGNMDELLQRAYEQDNLHELYVIARAYFKGFGVKQDYEKSFQLFQYLYGQGDDRGAYYLGYMYEYGYGIEQDIEKAMMYYSSHEDDQCFLRMGTLYMLGKYVEQDNEIALEYLMKSHEQDAYLYSGILLEKQHLYSDAFQAYLKGTQLFQKDCLYKVAIYLYKGIGTQLNQEEAYRYFRYAYYCLHGESAYQLSMIFFDGVVVEKNIKQALTFLTQAAKLSNQEACFMLARFYGEGLYVDKNFELSRQYYQKANELSDII